MYDELTTDLRRAANTWLAEEYKVCAEAVRYLLKESADAIEELTGFVQEAERDRDEYRERLDKANDAIDELVRKEKFHAFLWNTIQPNEMEQYLSMYRAQAVPSEPPKEE